MGFVAGIFVLLEISERSFRTRSLTTVPAPIQSGFYGYDSDKKIKNSVWYKRGDGEKKRKCVLKGEKDSIKVDLWKKIDREREIRRRSGAKPWAIPFHQSK